MGRQTKEEKEKELLEKIRVRYERSKKYKTYYTYSDLYCLAFLNGNQYVDWSGNQLVKVDLPTDYEPPRLTVNRLLADFESLRARIIQRLPRMFVLPRGDDEGSALACGYIMNYNDRVANEPLKVLELAGWVLANGMAWRKDIWNPNKGRKIKTGLYEGEFDTRIRPRMAIYTSPFVSNYEDIQWLVDEEIWDKDLLMSVYPDFKKEIELLQGSEINADLLKILGFQNYEQERVALDTDNSVTVKNYYEKDGICAVVAGENLVLRNEENPYGFIPYVPYFYRMIPGKFYPMGYVEPAIPVQKEYNKIKSKILENLEQTANIKLLEPDGCEVMESAFTDTGGERIRYKSSAGRKPEWLPPASLPAYVEYALRDCINDFMEMSGVHEISRGMSPPNLESGIALSYMFERDESRIAPVIKSFVWSQAKHYEMMLEICKENWKEHRKFTVIGKNNEWEVKEYTKSHLPDVIEIVAEVGTIPPSGSIRQQQLINLVNAQILNPVEDKDKILTMLEYGDADVLYKDKRLDMTNQKREIQEMIDGKSVPVNNFDNHTIHIEVINRFMKGGEFRKLDEGTKARLRQHAEGHGQIIMQQIQMQQQLSV